MRLDRRGFMSLAASAGLTLLGTPRALAGPTTPSAEPPYFLFVDAAGGWDPTLLCDPKGRAHEAEADPVNHYFSGEIRTAGSIPYAPVGGNAAFFERHHSRTLVLNGVDLGTVSHTVGARHQWSGLLDAGYPSLGALICGETAPLSALSYVSFGGYDHTAGLVPPTRFGDLKVLSSVIWPYRPDPADETRRFHSRAVADRIESARSRRRGYLEAQPLLPRTRAQLSQHVAARVDDDALLRLGEHLPSQPASSPLRRQVQLSMAAFRAGLTKAANLTTGGFDTHSEHDARHLPALSNLLDGVDFAWDEAERQGIADGLVVIVGSDLGRTPGYNAAKGKDHWPIGSVLLMGKGIKGNRVVGATTHRQVQRRVDPVSLAPVDSGGVALEPRHIHLALRRLAGVADAALAAERFPLEGAIVLPLAG